MLRPCPMLLCWCVAIVPCVGAVDPQRYGYAVGLSV
jgi:hypothetical protein